MIFMILDIFSTRVVSWSLATKNKIRKKLKTYSSFNLGSFQNARRESCAILLFSRSLQINLFKTFILTLTSTSRTNQRKSLVSQFNRN